MSCMKCMLSLTAIKANQKAFVAPAVVRCEGEACLIEGKPEAGEVLRNVSGPGHACVRSLRLHNLWLQAAGEHIQGALKLFLLACTLQQ